MQPSDSESEGKLHQGQGRFGRSGPLTVSLTLPSESTDISELLVLHKGSVLHGSSLLMLGKNTPAKLRTL